MQRIFGMLRTASGVDFSSYKPPTIRAGFSAGWSLHKLPDVDAYIRYMQQNPAEVLKLYQDILINVTRFFREPESFEALKTLVFPEILKHRGGGPTPHVGPGLRHRRRGVLRGHRACSSSSTRPRPMPMQIFATDVSDSAIEHAAGRRIPAEHRGRRLSRAAAALL